MKTDSYDCIVIGAGAAGLMAALCAGERGKRVLVLEKNARVGEKLRITGGGRCNIFNAEEDVHTLLRAYKKSAPFLYSAFADFGVADTKEFFEVRGLRTKVEDRKRAFPVTEKAEDVVRLLNDGCARAKVRILCREAATEIVTDRTGAVGVITRSGKSFSGKKIVLATGGLSHPETGSTGDGFSWLSELGHTVVPPTPTIVPVIVKEKWISKLAGKTLPNVRISYAVNGKIQKKIGNVLCTHTGLSGPIILNSTHDITAELEPAASVPLSIDLFPNHDVGSLDKALMLFLEQHKNKSLVNALKSFLPPGTAEVLLAEHAPHVKDKKVHSISKSERKEIAAWCKKITVTITGLLGFDKAVIADGGVPLTEVDTRTFESKKVKNLHIIGDLLHIERPSGGYSLQLCWTTGAVVGDLV